MKKIEDLEREIHNLKSLVLVRENAFFEKKLVSLRGIGKLSVSEDELEEAIEKAKKSLFAGVEDAVRD
ncbi:MAG TPA: hypothetical protein ENH28_05870 [Euryarchaeota archaeon]|nr:hypothetical protein [Euryarchaeota archaeon]